MCRRGVARTSRNGARHCNRRPGRGCWCYGYWCGGWRHWRGRRYGGWRRGRSCMRGICGECTRLHRRSRARADDWLLCLGRLRPESSSAARRANTYTIAGKYVIGRSTAQRVQRNGYQQAKRSKECSQIPDEGRSEHVTGVGASLNCTSTHHAFEKNDLSMGKVLLSPHSALTRWPLTLVLHTAEDVGCLLRRSGRRNVGLPS